MRFEGKKIYEKKMKIIWIRLLLGSEKVEVEISFTKRKKKEEKT